MGEPVLQQLERLSDSSCNKNSPECLAASNTHNRPHAAAVKPRPERQAPRPERQAVIAGTRPRPSSPAGDVVLAYLGVGAYLAGENAFTYGLLYEHELHQAEHGQADARRVWKRASRPRYRRWMK